MARERAISIAGAESSKPSNAAAAHCSDNAASSAPSPQPISTTRAGESPARAHNSTAWAALDRAPIARQRPIFRLCSWSSSE